MAYRSRIALLSRAASVVFGDKTGRRGESGWSRGAWSSRDEEARIVVCLNAALQVAERDLYSTQKAPKWFETSNDSYSELRTKEGHDAQVLLAETIVELYPELWEIEGADPPIEVTPENAQTIIISWNDGGHATTEGMEHLFWKTEQKAFERWFEEFRTDLDEKAPTEPFIDFIGAKE